MPIQETVSIDKTIALLNEALKIDPVAIQTLIEYHTLCNEDLADHPTIQVSEHPFKGYTYRVGMLGILNGLFGTDEKSWGAIAAVFSDENKLIGFERYSETFDK